MQHTLTNRHGLRLVVNIAPVANAAGLVFVQHGLSGFKEQPHIQTFVACFHAQGFSTVVFDATHSFGESGGDLFHASLTNHAHDLEDVITWAKTQPWFQSPFYLVGHSLGGASTLLYASKHPLDVCGLIPASSVISGTMWNEAHDVAYIQEWKKNGHVEKTSTSRPGASGKIGWAFVEDLMTHDLLATAGTMTIPALFIVGSLDTSTPPSQQHALYNAWGGEKNYHEIEGCGHTFKEPAHLAQLAEITQAWIRKTEEKRRNGALSRFI